MNGKIHHLDVQELRNIFADQRSWIELGKVLKVEKSEDQSVIRCLVEQFPEGDQIVCRMSWSGVGPEAGFYHPISVGDMVLMALEDGSRDNAYIISRLSSKDDKIPAQAMEDDTIAKALPGKKAHLVSDTRVNIGLGNPDAEPEEPLVLGNALVTALETYISDRIIEILDEFIGSPVGMGNLGNPVPLYATLSSNLGTIKAGIVSDKTSFQDFLSQIAYTEKG